MLLWPQRQSSWVDSSWTYTSSEIPAIAKSQKDPNSLLLGCFCSPEWNDHVSVHNFRGARYTLPPFTSHILPDMPLACWDADHTGNFYLICHSTIWRLFPRQSVQVHVGKGIFRELGVCRSLGVQHSEKETIVHPKVTSLDLQFPLNLHFL